MIQTVGELIAELGRFDPNMDVYMLMGPRVEYDRWRIEEVNTDWIGCDQDVRFDFVVLDAKRDFVDHPSTNSGE